MNVLINITEPRRNLSIPMVTEHTNNPNLSSIDKRVGVPLHINSQRGVGLQLINPESVQSRDPSGNSPPPWGDIPINELKLCTTRVTIMELAIMLRHGVLDAPIFYPSNMFIDSCGERTYSTTYVLLPKRTGQKINNVFHNTYTEMLNLIYTFSNGVSKLFRNASPMCIVLANTAFLTRIVTYQIMKKLSLTRGLMILGAILLCKEGAPL